MLIRAVTDDFRTQTYSSGSFAANHTFTRATPNGLATDLFWDSPSGFAYQTFADDVPVLTSRGLYVEKNGTTNYFLNSAAPATQTLTAVAGVYNLWVNGSGSVTLSAGTGSCTISANSPNQTYVVTQGNFLRGTCTAGTVTLTVSGALNFVQFQQGANWPSSGVVTTSQAVTRGADAIALQGQASAVMDGAYVGILMDTEYSKFTTIGTSTFQCMIRSGNCPIAITYLTGFYSADDQGGNAFYSGCGRGRLDDKANPNRTFIFWNPTTRFVACNGSLINMGSRFKVTNSTGRNLAGPSSGQPYMWIRSVTYWQASGTPTKAWMRAQTLGGVDDFSMVALGDSIVERGDDSTALGYFGTQSGNSFPYFLQQELGLTGKVLNAGIGGDSAAGARTRYLDAPEMWDRPLVVSIGWNDLTGAVSAQSVFNDIVTLVSKNTSGKVLVVSPLRGNSNCSDSGSVYTKHTQLRQLLSDRFGANYLDLTSAINAIDTDPLDAPWIARDCSGPAIRLPQRTFLTAGANFLSTDTTITFAAISGTASGTVLKFSNSQTGAVEYVLCGTGTTTTSCSNATRGYYGSTARALDDRWFIYQGFDTIHPGDYGHLLMAKAIAAKVRALRWF